MRDYMSPAKRVVERVIPHPGAARAFLLKHKAFAFIVTAAIVVITTLGFVTVRAIIASQNSSQHVMEAKSSTPNTSVSSTTVTTTPDQSVPTQADIKEGTTMPSSNASSQTKTDVTVNNQKIDVPQNGTTQKTITNGDGSTTNITITSNSNSNNSTSSTQVTTNTGSSQSVTSSNSMSVTRMNQ